MFEASVDGEAFDMDRWGSYFKPAGMGGSGSATGSSTQAASKGVPAGEDDAPFESAASAPAQVAEQATVAKTDAPASNGTDASARAQDILAMIRNRQKVE
jgi:hypothetical protein